MNTHVAFKAWFQSLQVQETFQNSSPTLRQLFCSLISGGVTALRMLWGGV